MCSEWFQNVLDGNGAPKVFDVFVFFPYECSTPGPHLRRRMMVEAGLVEGGSRTSSTFFGGGNAVDEFKDAAQLNFLA
jgi:hypothetical protein